MRMLREDTAAILIDVQERLLPAIHQGRELEGKIVKLVEGLRILDVPILPLRQYPKGLGDLTPAIREALGEYLPGDKITFSPWDTPEIADRIRSLGRKNILLCGVETHVCVLQTALDLLGAGYNVAVAADCVGSRNPYDREIGLDRMVREGALPTTGESALFELLREAGTDTFKRISALVK